MALEPPSLLYTFENSKKYTIVYSTVRSWFFILQNNQIMTKKGILRASATLPPKLVMEVMPPDPPFLRCCVNPMKGGSLVDNVFYRACKVVKIYK